MFQTDTVGEFICKTLREELIARKQPDGSEPTALRLPNFVQNEFANSIRLEQEPHHQDGVSYLELAGLLVQQGAHVAHDLTELWRRIVFNICISNTDDHLRNHSFLLTPQGWRLSPAP